MRACGQGLRLRPQIRAGASARSLRSFASGPQGGAGESVPAAADQVTQPEISNNVGSVKLSMSAFLRSLQRVSLFVVFFGPVDDHGSPVIFRSVSVRPTHLFDPSFRVAVGTPVAQRPPHRSARAVFLHAALTA